jgi:membrane associated rhomboid family serine protease
MQGTQIQLPTLTKINKILIIAAVAMFLLDSILRQTGGMSIAGLLALQVDTLASGFIHTFFTYIIIPRGLMDVLFECLILWFLGSELESRWGTRRYIFYVGFITIAAAIFYLLAATAISTRAAPFQGLGVISSALCVSYAVLFPERNFTFMFLFPMKARIFCLLLAGITLYGAFFGGGGASAVGLLGAMAMGYVALMIMANPLMKGLFESKPSSFYEEQRRKAKVQKSHLKIVGKDDDDKKPPTYH